MVRNEPFLYIIYGVRLQESKYSFLLLDFGNNGKLISVNGILSVFNSFIFHKLHIVICHYLGFFYELLMFRLMKVKLLSLHF